jgi:hypothetical protein
MDEKWIIGGVVLLFVLIAGSGIFANRERAECRKEGLAANKTVDEIVKLCNLPGRR